MSHPPQHELPSLSTSLLDQIRQMEPAAWTRLVETFSPIVYAWCRKAGLNGHDSADCVQEVFLSVSRGIGKFDRQKSSGSFRSWLATITRNRITDYYRKGNKQVDSPGGTDFLQQIQNQPDLLDQSISEVSLNQALPLHVMSLVKNEVEPKTWLAFWKSTVDELPVADVAGELGMSVASIYQAKSRVLRRIRQRMAELP